MQQPTTFSKAILIFAEECLLPYFEVCALIFSSIIWD